MALAGQMVVQVDPCPAGIWAPLAWLVGSSAPVVSDLKVHRSTSEACPRWSADGGQQEKEAASLVLGREQNRRVGVRATPAVILQEHGGTLLSAAR